MQSLADEFRYCYYMYTYVCIYIYISILTIVSLAWIFPSQVMTYAFHMG